MGKFKTRWLAAVLLVAGMVVAGAAFAGEEKSGVPAVSVDEPEFDFGTVYAGQPVYHSFELRNTGDAPLVIDDVKTG